MKIKPYLIFFGLVLAGITSSAQNDSTAFLTKAFKTLDNYSAKNPVEKVYLQIDRSYYVPGDTIWLKAYVTAGVKQVPSGISNVLNVVLMDGQGEIRQMDRLPVIGGLTWGDISLADTLPPGNYRIVAYTNWMRNAGADYFFNRNIRIMKPGPVLPVASPSARKDSIKRTGEKADIRFFPESGSLVDGVRSKVAFKAMTSNGLGIDANGIVTDDTGQQVAVFKSSHLGMGIFYLTPEQGKSYKASVTFADGSQCVVNLPAAAGRGFVMNINNADSSTIRVTVTASRGIVNDPQQFGEVNLVAQAGGRVYYTARSKVTSEPLVALVPKSKFPAGIVQFTLFSADGEPLNERIAFIEPHDQVRLALKPDKAGAYVPRQKVRISLDAADSSRKPLTASLSASVVNESVLHEDADTDPGIFSFLLLTSDIKGYIEKPGYYFSNTGAARSDLDILMLTQGYRRFEWKKILTGDETPASYAPEKTLTVSGHVKTPGGKPVAKAKVSLLSSQGGFMMLDTVTDQNGRFVFDKLMIIDSLRCKIQAHTAKNGQNVVVTIDDSLPQLPNYGISAAGDSTIVIRVATPARQPVSNIPDKIPANGHAKALKGVTIKATKPLLENSSNLNGPGNADQVVLFKNISLACPSIAECLIGKLVGVFFKYDPQNFDYFPCMYSDGNIVILKIMVDGVMIDPKYLNTIPVETVESVELLRSSNYTSIYGNDAHNGLILVNTKKGNFSGITSKPNIANYTVKGYYKAREFYSPKYDHTGPGNSTADNRITVYWKPNIITGKDGKAWIEYYNADGKGTYRVIVEGIDENGRLGRAVYRYKVE
ncbi:MAG TPA: hypothetical protein VHB54_03985 [Mucilaginibacter sp.]|nr:hypothetical protein [Mucilaginibacter sp.]